MSTRAVIGRKTATGFTGVYHHWDGYPSGLGATLYALRKSHFKGDTQAMLKTLIDAHPAGWSTINRADFTKEPGFSNDVGVMGKAAAPSCYCHGDRHEQGQKFTEANSSGSGVEWAYVFDGNGKMEVQSSYRQNGAKMIGAFGCGDPKSTWRTVATVDLDAPEPDWAEMES